MAEKEDAVLRVQEAADGTAIVGDPPPADDDHDDEDRHATNNEDGGHEDEHGTEGETDEERAARTERNRQRRKENKERRQQYVDSLRRELEMERSARQQLEQRFSTIERRTTGSEMAALDAAERQAREIYEQNRLIHAKAVETQNGGAATEAQERMFAARDQMLKITNIRQAMTRQQQAPQPLDPVLRSNAEDFIRKNPWYDPNLRDEDSTIVKALDDRLANEGWDPRTPQYWQELQTRVEKYLPHRKESRYNRDRSGSSTPRAPVPGSSRDSGSSAKAGTYTLSAERVRALKEAGMWDDEKTRAKMIRRYQEEDRQNAGRN